MVVTGTVARVDTILTDPGSQSFSLKIYFTDGDYLFASVGPDVASDVEKRFGRNGMVGQRLAFRVDVLDVPSDGPIELRIVHRAYVYIPVDAQPRTSTASSASQTPATGRTTSPSLTPISSEPLSLQFALGASPPDALIALLKEFAAASPNGRFLSISASSGGIEHLRIFTIRSIMVQSFRTGGSGPRSTLADSVTVTCGSATGAQIFECVRVRILVGSRETIAVELR